MNIELLAGTGPPKLICMAGFGGPVPNKEPVGFVSVGALVDSLLPVISGLSENDGAGPPKRELFSGLVSVFGLLSAGLVADKFNFSVKKRPVDGLLESFNGAEEDESGPPKIPEVGFEALEFPKRAPVILFSSTLGFKKLVSVF
jgi:hypothetical protein